MIPAWVKLLFGGLCLLSTAALTVESYQTGNPWGVLFWGVDAVLLAGLLIAVLVNRPHQRIRDRGSQAAPGARPMRPAVHIPPPPPPGGRHP